MKLIPHIRTRRWIWLGITLLVTTMWSGSMLWALYFVTNKMPAMAAGVSGGRLAVKWVQPKPVNWRVGWNFERSRFVDWGFDWIGQTIVIPLWPGVLGGAVLTIIAFRRVGQLRAHSCSSCGYPRAGLPDAAPCPECGKNQRGTP